MSARLNSLDAVTFENKNHATLPSVLLSIDARAGIRASHAQL